MNHSFEVNSISNSNSDLSNSSGGASRRLGSLAVMNRDQSHHDSDDVEGSGKNDKQAMTPLPEGFRPGDDDVICGRGKKCYAHTGNERFRQIVQSHLTQYRAATSRPEKSEILSSIVAQVRKNSPDGGFVKQDTNTGAWFEVGDFLAREKTSQAFRDALHEDYRSSKKSKHEKRRQRTQAKALSEKQATSKGPPPLEQAVETQTDQHQVLYSSPLISRQQLTVLREENTSHPRAFSFSGHSQEPFVRDMPTRALSMSSVAGPAGRLGDRTDLGLGLGLGIGLSLGLTSEHLDLPYREQFRRSDSISDLNFGQRYPADDLDVDTGGPRLQDQLEGGHESWPQPLRTTSTRSLLAPPLGAPIFHPVGEDDVAAHRLRPDVAAHRMHSQNTEAAVMAGGGGNVAPRFSGAARFSRWSEDELDGKVSSARLSRTSWPDTELDRKVSTTRLPRWSDSELDGKIQLPSRRPRPSDEEDALDSPPRRSFLTATPLNAFSATPNAAPSAPSVERFASAAQAAGGGIDPAVHKRTDSSSATVIVAQLANALQPDSLVPDDNPFEPIPLGERSKKKAKIESGEQPPKW